MACSLSEGQTTTNGSALEPPSPVSENGDSITSQPDDKFYSDAVKYWEVRD